MSDVYLNHIVKRPGYNLNHLKDDIQDQGNLIFQEMIRNIKIIIKINRRARRSIPCSYQKCL